MQCETTRTITTTPSRDRHGAQPFKDRWEPDIAPSPPASTCPSFETVSEARHPLSPPLEAKLPRPTSSPSPTPSSQPCYHDGSVPIPPAPKTDPAETKQQWEQVYAVNELLMVELMSSASTAVSGRLGGIFIDDTFQFVDVDKHFSQFNGVTHSTTLGTTTAAEGDSYRGLYNVMRRIQRSEAYNRHEELKDANQAHLAPCHYMPATGGTSTWTSERFLKVDLSRENNDGVKWQQLKIQGRNQNQQETNASGSPPPTASITYWLRKQSAP